MTDIISDCSNQCKAGHSRDPAASAPTSPALPLSARNRRVMEPRRTGRDVEWKSCQFGRPIGPNPHTGRSTHCGEFLKAPASPLGAAMCRWTAGACGSKLREKKGRCGHGNIRKLEDPIETDSRCCKAPKCSPNLEPHIAMILVAESAPNAAIRRAFLRWDATNHLKDLLGFRFTGWYRTCPHIYIYL